MSAELLVLQRRVQDSGEKGKKASTEAATVKSEMKKQTEILTAQPVPRRICF